jgi:hypothetical protein
MQLKHVEAGMRIISDCWGGYTNLKTLGFDHATINHSQNFVHPDDLLIHTDTMERQWRTLKEIILKSCHGKLRWSYLAEFIWKGKVKWDFLAIGKHKGNNCGFERDNSYLCTKGEYCPIID